MNKSSDIMRLRFLLYIAMLAAGLLLVTYLYDLILLLFLNDKLYGNEIFASAIAIFLLTLPAITYNWWLKNNDTLEQSEHTQAQIRKIDEQQKTALFSNALQLLFRKDDPIARAVGLKELIRLKPHNGEDHDMSGRIDLITASGLNLENSPLQKADLQGANLEEANLKGANLLEANLKGANLLGAILEEAILPEADLQGADLRIANLQKATLVGANLEGVNLYEAVLHGARLQRANLQGANLTGAKLQGANLLGANLQRANLLGADLQGVSLYGVKCLTPDMLRKTINWRKAHLDTSLRQQTEEADRADEESGEDD